MKFSGQQFINASPAVVFAALVDPQVLRDCIPGCEELEKASATDFKAKVRLKLGPVNASFSGSVQLSDLAPPHGCLLSGQGDAGVAGFAKGTARVRLEEQDGATMLQWDADVQLGGKIAQLGGRLLDSVAKKLAGQFFASLASHVVKEPDTGEQSVQTDVPVRRKLHTWHLVVGMCTVIALVTIVAFA